MPEEIRENMMAHALKDKVREAYFLADPNELEKVYYKLWNISKSAILKQILLTIQESMKWKLLLWN